MRVSWPLPLAGVSGHIDRHCNMCPQATPLRRFALRFACSRLCCTQVANEKDPERLARHQPRAGAACSHLIASTHVFALTPVA